MRKISQKTKLWQYLNSIGVLEKGTEEEIKTAKKQYRKQYILEQKRKERKMKSEYTVGFSKEKGEHQKIHTAAKMHRTKPTVFIREATLAYLENAYIAPDTLVIAKLEQLLRDCLNEIRSILQPKERYIWERDRKFENIEKRIAKLEQDIRQTLLATKPLQHDSKNISTQKAGI